MTVIQSQVANNENVLAYGPGSPERSGLQQALREQAARIQDIPLVIGGRHIQAGQRADVVAPHRHRHVLARVSQASGEQAQQHKEGSHDRIDRIRGIRIRK